MKSIYEKICIPLIKVNSNVYVFFSGILMSLSINIFTTLCFDEINFYNQWLKYFMAFSILISSALCMIISLRVVNIQNYFLTKQIIDDDEKTDIIKDLTKNKVGVWVSHYSFLSICLFLGIVLLMVL